MKKILIKSLKILLWIAVIWGLLTLIAELPGGSKIFDFGVEENQPRAMVFYDPDPFYNLDEQVSKGVAEGLVEEGWQVKVATVKAAKAMNVDADLYVFCANTYNWAPDWAVTGMIRRTDLAGKPVVAITLGSGSTYRSKRILEARIQQKQANLIDSETYWLMRPNDEERMDERNVAVAVDMAHRLGRKVAGKLL
ncbi:MAG: hypothetical protein R2824_34145 [Saprospiraceae bacterium]|nr:hypothetical protein [Lewinella sp.]